MPKYPFQNGNEFINYMLGVFKELDELTPDPMDEVSEDIDNTVGSMKANLILFKEREDERREKSSSTEGN